MHDHALRLVDDGKVVVLIDDLNGDVLGQRLGLAHGRERDADGVSGGNAGILGGGSAANGDRPLGKQTRRRRAGHTEV